MYQKRFKSILPASVLVAALVLNDPIGGVSREIIKNTWALITSPPSLIQRASGPDAGFEFQQREIIEARALIQKHRVPNFRLSKGISSNGWFLLQMTTSNWPTKIEPDSRFLVRLNSENIPGCSEVDKLTEVTLADCH